MVTLLLVRHGLSTANQEKFFAGQLDAPLLPAGAEQARCTAQFIRAHYQVEEVYSSDLSRAMETAKILAAPWGLPVIPDPGLREICAGKWQGVSFDVLQREDPMYQVWLKDIGHVQPPEGESVRELGQRIQQTLTRIAREQEGKTLVISTHATPIRVARCMFSGADLERMREFPWVTNASVTELIYRAGTWRLGKISQDAHLRDLATGFPANV